MDHRVDAELGQLFDDVRNLRVAQVGHVLFERQTEDTDLRLLERHVHRGEVLHRLLREERGDVVVDATAGEDDLGQVAELLGLHRQIVRIDADAVTTDETRGELQEVPLGAGGFEDVVRADAHAIEDQRELVHQRDVEIALRVLDDLCRFGDLDGGCPVDAGPDDGAVNL